MALVSATQGRKDPLSLFCAVSNLTKILECFKAKLAYLLLHAWQLVLVIIYAQLILNVFLGFTVKRKPGEKESVDGVIEELLLCQARVLIHGVSNHIEVGHQVLEETVVLVVAVGEDDHHDEFDHLQLELLRALLEEPGESILDKVADGRVDVFYSTFLLFFVLKELLEVLLVVTSHVTETGSLEVEVELEVVTRVSMICMLLFFGFFLWRKFGLFSGLSFTRDGLGFSSGIDWLLLAFFQIQRLPSHVFLVRYLVDGLASFRYARPLSKLTLLRGS